jgi:hypothetical protein
MPVLRQTHAKLGEAVEEDCEFAWQRGNFEELLPV